MGAHSEYIPTNHWLPGNEEERRAVREQLERVLASPLFNNSKRYPALLRYVVEESLCGRAENLKERTLGIDVFNRDSQYDSNADPVVRVTAGEIRRRLAQYYYESGHDAEIHIELPSGAYVPEFRLPHANHLASRELPQQHAYTSERAETLAASLPQASPELAVVASPVETPSKGALRHWLLFGAALAALIGILTAVAVYRARTSQQILAQFWGPVLRSSGPALLCLGDRASWDNGRADAGIDLASTKNLTVGEYIENQDHVVMTDVLTLNRIAATLQSLGKGYRIKNASETNLSDLREGPAVLIGGGNNGWTLRLTASLRFSFVMESDGGRIVDKQNPSQLNWKVPLSTPYRLLNEDYGIIARLKDPTTDQPVIVAAGLAAQGTIATGEMLSNPEFLQGLLLHAPANWQHMNLEAVIATEVIDGKSGPPRVVAVNFW